MDSKLTLKLNQEVIEKAKRYASDKKISLSRLIEAYLNSITSGNKLNDFEISPFIKSMATGKNFPADIDYKKEYGEYLMQKHK